MDIFLAEVYDAPSFDVDAHADLFDKENKLLRYSHMFNDPTIHRNILFSWIWDRFFGTQPSKLDLYQASLSIGESNPDLAKLAGYIMNHTFIKYIKKTFDQVVPGWTNDFVTFSTELAKYPSIVVKRELTHKLLGRFAMAESDVAASPEELAAFHEKTLYAQYLTIVKLYAKIQYSVESASIQEVYAREGQQIHDMQLLDHNPLAKTIVVENKLPHAFESKFKHLTVADAMRSILTRDHYFLRSCFDHSALFVASAIPGTLVSDFAAAFKSMHGSPQKMILLTSSSIQRSAGVRIFCIPPDLVRHASHAVPSFFRRMALWDPPAFMCERGYTHSVPQSTTLAFVSTPRACVHMRTIELYAQAPLLPLTSLALPADSGFFMTKHLRPAIQAYLRTSVDAYTAPSQSVSYHDAYAYVLSELLAKAHRENLDPVRLTTSKNAKNAVMFIDNRENSLSVLTTTLTFSKLRSKEWNLVVFTSSKSLPFYRNCFGDNADIEYHALPELDHDSFDMDDYNALVKSTRIWELLEPRYTNVLLIQDDCALMRPGLEARFLDRYDYVGAPWDPTVEWNNCTKKMSNPQMVGNGGYSLRNVKCMLRCCQELAKEANGYTELFNNDIQPFPEDVFFARTVHATGGRIPTAEEAGVFSTEEVFEPQALAFHKVWAYLPFHQVRQYFSSLSNNPEVGQKH